MFNLNTVMLCGRLGADAEIKTLPGDRGKVASFNLAVDTTFKDRTGKYHTDTDWFRVVTFLPGLIDKIVAKEGVKGRLMYVQGRLRARSYEQDGQKRTAYEVEVDPTGGLTPIVEDKA